MQSDVWVTIPAYNEGGVIRDVVRSVLSYGYNVVVVDDCSDEHLEYILRGLPVYLCRHCINLGQGAALQTGIEFALKKGAKAIVTFDADGQHQANEIANLLQPILAGKCDAVLGSRFVKGGLALNIPLPRKWMLLLATWITRLSTGLKLTDTHNGFRAFSDRAARQIKITQDRMAHASQILTLISQLKISYTEVPVTIDYSAYSLGKGQKMRNAFNVVWDSLAAVFTK